MQDPNQEIYVAIVAAILLAVLLVGFFLSIFFMYQQKRRKQEKEILNMKEKFDQELLRSQLEIQESTLKGISQELHDNIGQELSVIKLWLEALPLEKDHSAFAGLQESREVLKKVIFELSDLTKSLHADRIADIGLVDAIHFDVLSLRRSGTVAFSFESSGEEFLLDKQKAIFLFRIYQETINNILKHSGALRVDISVTCHEQFVLTVKDDGVGFDFPIKKTANSFSGLGMNNMLSRAKLIGAIFSVKTAPGQGTEIRVEMPNT